MTLTQEQRIAVIKHAHQNSQRGSATKSVEDFLSEIKSEEVIGEHGLFNIQDNDVQDELSLFCHKPEAEEIDEEDIDFGISDQMRGIYS